MKKFGITCFIGGVLFTCIIISILLYVLSMPQKNQIKFNKAPEGFAIMIFDETIQNYVETEGIPIGLYELNSDKSYCTNGGIIDSYDRKTGKLNYSVVGSDECVIYLDILPDKENPVIANVSQNNKTLTATLSDDIALAGYSLTTSDTEPTSWNAIDSSSYHLTTDVSELGEYYLWVKDGVGNVISQHITMGHKIINLGCSAPYYEGAANGWCYYNFEHYGIFGISSLSATGVNQTSYETFKWYERDYFYVSLNQYFGPINGSADYPIYTYFCETDNCSSSNSVLTFAQHAAYSSDLWKQIPENANYILLYTAWTCFKDDTYVYIYDEKRKRKFKRKIKYIKKGDFVYAYDDELKKVVRKKVTNVLYGLHDKICNIYIDNEVITVTQNHKLYVKSKGYIKAKDIVCDDILINSIGREINIKNIEIIRLKKPIKVVSLELENGNNVLIGNSKLLASSLISLTLLLEFTPEIVKAKPTPC